MNQKIPLIAAVAVCAFAGFIVGRISSDPGERPSETADGTLGPRTGTGLNRGNLSGNSIGPRASGRPGRTGLERLRNSSSDEASAIRIESIINNPNPLQRAEQWLRFVKGLDPSEIEAAVADFRGKGLASGNLSEYAMLLDAWASHDPYAALDYAQKNTGTPFARQTILATWATSDPIAAKRWAEDNHDGDGANPWMVGVIRGVAASDPDYATKLMTEMPYSSERALALAEVQDYYLKQGAEVAREWALSIKDDKLREGVMQRVAEKLAQTDPLGTANWLQANPSEGANRAMSSVMERMAGEDPQAAISYFDSISDPKLKAKAMEGIADKLAAKDPDSALSFMDMHPEYVTDHVVQDFAFSARRKDPVMGANAISRINDQKQRTNAYGRYLWRWMRDDKEGVLNWANQADLPEDVMRMVENYASHIERRNNR